MRYSTIMRLRRAYKQYYNRLLGKDKIEYDNSGVWAERIVLSTISKVIAR